MYQELPELVPGWSMDVHADSMNGLHNAWFNRYSNAYVEAKKAKKRVKNKNSIGLSI